MNEQTESARIWSVLFETEDGSCHPVRYCTGNPLTRAQIQQEAERYLAKNCDWLQDISDIYPVEN